MFIVDVYAVLELCIPVFATSTLAVITVPDAFNLVAVMLSIISMFATVAPLIKISSDSDLISNNDPNACESSSGTITIELIVGAS